MSFGEARGVARFACVLAVIACCAACINFALLLVIPSYDLQLGPLHLVAHGTFKPLQILAATFWIAAGLCGAFLSARQPQSSAKARPAARWIILALTVLAFAAIYFASAGINVSNPDWTASDVSERISSFSGILGQFTLPRSDGFYRPLPSLSLGADFHLFGSRLWAYHVQNILLHALNAILVFRLLRELRAGRAAAGWSAAWFLLAAANFEPVLWPAARFDLFATAFVLVSLIFFLKYLRSSSAAISPLIISAGAYTLGILSKESAYCLPLLLLAIVLTRRLWELGPLDRGKLLRGALVFGGLTAAMVAVRIGIYRGLGGYPAAIAGGASPHFVLTLKSIFGILTRVFPLPLFGLNFSVPLPAAMKFAAIIFAAAILLCVLSGAYAGRPELALVGFGLLAALPAINIVGWVDETMRHSRYLYLPGIFMIAAAAGSISRARWGQVALAAIVAVNAAGAAHNVGAYRDLIGAARDAAAQISADCERYGAATVDLTGIDPRLSGVLFFGSEMADRLHEAQPAVCIRLSAGACEPGGRVLSYRWSGPFPGALRYFKTPAF